MDISLKYKIVEKIIQSEDENLLNEVGAIMGLKPMDFWHDLPQQLQQSINEAKEELDKGEGIPHDEVKAEVRARFYKV